MEKGSDRSADRKGCHYRITVRGELSERFVEPLEQVFVESAGDKSILRCDVADQAKLRAILDWLYARGVEIVSVVPDDGGPDCGDR
jgi:hypothetical protein